MHIVNRTCKAIKLILATSYFEFYIAQIMKQFNLLFDVILHNTKTTAFLLNKELYASS